MDRLNQPLEIRANYKWLGILGVIGLILFLFVQVFPQTSSETLEGQTTKVISKSEAEAAAKAFASDRLNIQTGIAAEPLVTYQSESDLYGYLSKEKLLTEYNKKYEPKYPYDVFRVRLPESSDQGYVNVDVHMNTGKVVGFSITPPYSKYAAAMAETNETMRKQKLRIVEGDMTLEDKEEIASSWLQKLGYNTSSLKVSSGKDEPGLIYTDSSSQIGESQLEFKFAFEDGELHSFLPGFSVPSAHTAYVEKQTNSATMLTMLGYGLFTIVLGILAIIYSALTRRYTSFARGLFLSLFYFVVSLLTTYNMLPVLEAEGFSQFGLIVAMVVQVILSIAMTVLLYFSLVGGDGLWRKAGYNAWARAKEPGYGRYVLHSMFTGYLWAFILMGAQSVIYLVLDRTIHSWSTTDASQSPYNMLYPWMLPIMAWMAGISEEAVYRLFGIPMLKKIVRNTFVACVIPTLIWAFGHTLYPIYPIYTRPIELLFIGLLFSLIFLRHGYIAVMFAHVVFDSILMSFSLFSMGDLTNILAGVVTCVMPFIVAWVIYLFYGKKKEKPYVTTPPPEGLL
uniref:CPBP family intramembrane glutamic endopeptidase n=1 Tax=Paenibacillus terrae TaxID=159743 RepID=UPI0011A5BEE6|nr:type II CAAX endopeptidase family protein [Paenibacillus terrae]